MQRVAVVGVGQTHFVSHRTDVMHPELCFEAVKGALGDANIGIEDVNAIVFGVMDGFDGVDCLDRWCSGAVGGYGRQFMRINTAGATGMSTAIAAYHQVASGLVDIALAVAEQRVSESVDAQSILNTAACPIYDRNFGGTAITLGSLPATRHMTHYGSTHMQRALVSVKNHHHGCLNPYAHLRFEVTVDEVLESRLIEWPLHLLECCPRSDGAVAVVLAGEHVACELTDHPAWIRGAVSIADTFFYGDRPDVSYRDNLAVAARKLYRRVGIQNPRKEIDVAELYSPFTSLEIMQTEALGFCAEGEGTRLVEEGVTWLGGEIPVNPSGGVLCTNPIGATGLVRVAEAALQVMGRAGAHQVPGVKTALCHGLGGVLQFQTLMLLDTEPR